MHDTRSDNVLSCSHVWERFIGSLGLLVIGGKGRRLASFRRHGLFLSNGRSVMFGVETEI